MKKKTIGNKFGIIVVTLALSMAMLAGCGNTSDRNADEVSTEEAADPAGMVHLESAEDVTQFMDEVYGGVGQDLLPMNVTTTELDLSQNDMVEYHTGLVAPDGIAGIYLSESMITSAAYCAIYIRTNDEVDAETIRQQLMDSVNPAKWVCVTAEKQSAVILGNDVFFVMGFTDTADAVIEQAIEAAKKRVMNVSETLEESNPI